ncbi:hypothetical protein JHK85_003887 [Glycine max]|nr:hypothetical protein JHK85_003887 [Glycine max]
MQPKGVTFIAIMLCVASVLLLRAVLGMFLLRDHGARLVLRSDKSSMTPRLAVSSSLARKNLKARLMDKATIIDEVVKYIKFLEETCKKLEKQKQERAQYVLKEVMATSNAVSITTGKKQVAFDKT